MSDEECAFDNWEEAAEEGENIEETQPKEEEQEKKAEEKQEEEKNIQQVAKITLKDRIAKAKQQDDQNFANEIIEGVSQANQGKNKLAGNQIMKSNKDFEDYAKLIADRLGRDVGEDPIDDECLATLVEDLTLYLYKGLEWKNFFEVNKKLKVVKNQRKNQEKKLAKQKQKIQRQKKVEETQQSNEAVRRFEEKPVGDQLFGGAGMINSKQEQEERKKKAAQLQAKKEKEEEEKAKETIPPAADDDDDDDFM